MTAEPCDICQKGDCYKLTFIENNLFGHLFMGVYVNNDDTLPPNTKLLCKTCVKKYKFEEYKHIECSICHEKFQNMMYNEISTEDGYGCACTIHEDRITCGYGSGHDGSTITYTDKRPAYLKLESNVCDACLDDLIKDNICKEITPYFDPEFMVLLNQEE